MHVSNRINMHQRRYGVHNDEHDSRQTVNTEGPIDGKVAGLNPAHNHFGKGAVKSVEINPTQNGRDHQKSGSHILGSLVADLTTKQSGNQKAKKRKEDD